MFETMPNGLFKEQAPCVQADVLVVGAGIAGVTAARSAASALADGARPSGKAGGSRVLLATQGPLFSGSSFFPGTWGLGLVGPESIEDEADLERAILDVGCGMADPNLVRTFVHGITPAVARLEKAGARLKRPGHADEREFIPCFDRKHRAWRGILREPFESAMRSALRHAGVRPMEGCELVDLEEGLEESSRSIVGAILFDHSRAQFLRVHCRSVVLACGGFGGLFDRSLAGVDVTGAAHAIALRHGALMVNAEFIQIMPGLVRPCRNVVFNEKAFRFMELDDSPAARLLTSRPDAGALLDERSGYGPFTSRLASRAVDAAIDAAGQNGLSMRCRPTLLTATDSGHDGTGTLPEFVREYYDWLETSWNVRPEDWMGVALYAHASNGGLRIDENAWTGVPGLFACGEMTGGMHGADRIGGLSSANGLVFGDIAGKSAAKWAIARSAKQPCGQTPSQDQSDCTACKDLTARADSAQQSPATPFKNILKDTASLRRRLRQTMSTHCMVARTEKGLARTLEEIERLTHHADDLLESCRTQSALGLHAGNRAGNRIEGPIDVPKGETANMPGEQPQGRDGQGNTTRDDAARALAGILRLRNQLQTARCIVSAMRARRESRGSHNRADFPAQDHAFARSIVIGLDCDGRVFYPNSHFSQDATSR